MRFFGELCSKKKSKRYTAPVRRGYNLIQNLNLKTKIATCRDFCFCLHVLHLLSAKVQFFMKKIPDLLTSLVASATVSEAEGGQAFEHSRGGEYYETGHRRPPVETSFGRERKVSLESPPLIPISAPDPQMSLGLK